VFDVDVRLILSYMHVCKLVIVYYKLHGHSMCANMLYMRQIVLKHLGLK